MTTIVRLAATSCRRWCALARSGRIGRTSLHLHQRYAPDQGGVYEVFRETRGDDGIDDPPVVLVVGFRLRVLRNNSAGHWLFRRVCLLTTPFWSGFRGFRIKLWMDDPITNNYLGIYEWAGENHARTYAEALARVLRPLSTPASVWYQLIPSLTLHDYLEHHPAPPPPLGAREPEARHSIPQTPG